MLIGLLVGAIVALFGGGEPSEYAASIPKMQKEIKRHVEDEARKDSLVVLVKAYEKEIKKSDKEIRKIQKNMYKDAGNREVSTDEFLEVYDAYFKASGDLLSSLIEYRLAFQEQITGEELLLVSENAREEVKKEEEKKDKKKEKKGEEKIEDQIRESFVGIKEIVNKDIEDPDKAAHLSALLDEFEAKIQAFIIEGKEIDIRRLELLNDKHASREELDEIYAKSNQIRFDASRIYAKFREEAIQNTTKKEWKSIQKDLKKFTKGES